MQIDAPRAQGRCLHRFHLGRLCRSTTVEGKNMRPNPLSKTDETDVFICRPKRGQLDHQGAVYLNTLSPRMNTKMIMSRHFCKRDGNDARAFLCEALPFIPGEPTFKHWSPKSLSLRQPSPERPQIASGSGVEPQRLQCEGQYSHYQGKSDVPHIQSRTRSPVTSSHHRSIRKRRVVLMSGST